MRVLVTRAHADAEGVAKQLAALGHEAVLAPVIRVVPTDIAAPPGPFDATVATSAHALTRGKAGPDSQRQKPFFAIGARTAEAARETGFTDVRRCGGDAAALAALVGAAMNRPARVLYLAGRDRKPTLETALIEAGLSVSVHEVYQARSTEAWADAVTAALRTHQVDAALHFSRRSAALALDLARHHEALAAFLRLRHYCLSPDVAAPLRLSGVAAIEVAPRPDSASLLTLLTKTPEVLL